MLWIFLYFHKFDQSKQEYSLKDDSIEFDADYLT